MGKARHPGARDPTAVIQQIYRGSMATDTWRATLRSLREYLGGATAALIRHDYGSRQGAILLSDGFDQKHLASYNEYYNQVNPWLTHGRILSLGDVRLGQQMISDQLFLKTEYYNDWLKPQGLFHTIRGVIHRNEAEIFYVSVARPKDAEPFEQSDVLALQQLVPHFQCAITGFELLSRQRTIGEGALAVLDILPFGVAIFDAHHRPVSINRTGRDILSENDGLMLRLTGLRAAVPREQEQLSRLLEMAVDGDQGSDHQPLLRLAISRPSGRRPLSLTACPLPRNDPIFYSSQPAVIVIFGDSERDAEADDDALRRFYGLTPTEARVAGYLAKGYRIDDAADQLHISGATARTHLKHIFSKTDTTRQAELVRLVLTSPAHLRSLGQ